MHALLLFLAGAVVFFGAGAFMVMSLFDTSGRWWVTALGGVTAVAAFAAVLLAARAAGFGWVGAP